MSLQPENKSEEQKSFASSPCYDESLIELLARWKLNADSLMESAKLESMEGRYREAATLNIQSNMLIYCISELKNVLNYNERDKQ